MKLSTGFTVAQIPDFSKLSEEQKQRCWDWITALKSGDYVQAKTQLKVTTERFCCLGVACDVAAKVGVGKWSGRDEDIFIPSGRDWTEGASSALPLDMVTHYGLEHQTGFDVSGHFKEGGRTCQYSLSNLNDFSVATFLDIALILETALAGGLQPTAN